MPQSNAEDDLSIPLELLRKAVSNGQLPSSYESFTSQQLSEMESAYLYYLSKQWLEKVGNRVDNYIQKLESTTENLAKLEEGLVKENKQLHADKVALLESLAETNGNMIELQKKLFEREKQLFEKEKQLLKQRAEMIAQEIKHRSEMSTLNEKLKEQLEEHITEISALNEIVKAEQEKHQLDSAANSQKFAHLESLIMTMASQNANPAAVASSSGSNPGFFSNS